MLGACMGRLPGMHDRLALTGAPPLEHSRCEPSCGTLGSGGAPQLSSWFPRTGRRPRPRPPRSRPRTRSRWATAATRTRRPPTTPTAPTPGSRPRRRTTRPWRAPGPPRTWPHCRPLRVYDIAQGDLPGLAQSGTLTESSSCGSVSTRSRMFSVMRAGAEARVRGGVARVRRARVRRGARAQAGRARGADRRARARRPARWRGAGGGGRGARRRGARAPRGGRA
jgi:hypothetical protein